MSKHLTPWKYIFLFDVDDNGCEFALFTDQEHLDAYKAGDPMDVRYVEGDVAYGEGSSWNEFGPRLKNNPFCDDNILAERQDIVPWKSKAEFDAFVQSLET
jgi:hypothetical protein